MSMYLEFEPHSWYMGFAIKDNRKSGHDQSNLEREMPSHVGYRWNAYIDDGNTYRIHSRHANTLAELKEQVRDYHVRQGNGYGERTLKRLNK